MSTNSSPEHKNHSFWLDYSRPCLFNTAALDRLIHEDNVSGVVCNPDVMYHVLLGDDDYDNILQTIIRTNPELSPAEIYKTLIAEDAKKLTDKLAPVYDRSGGTTGFACVTLPAAVFHSNEELLREARSVWSQVDRSNLMFYVPATREGLAAGEALIAEGMNVYFDGITCPAHYEQAAYAYMRGLKRAEHPQKMLCVASIWTNHVAEDIDTDLAQIGSSKALSLQKKAVRAVALCVYQKFADMFYGAPFAKFREQRAPVQKLHWAAAHRKNPDYSDKAFLKDLAQNNAITMLTPETLALSDAFDHIGQAPSKEEIKAAEETLRDISEQGVNIQEIGEQRRQEELSRRQGVLNSIFQVLTEKQSPIQGHKSGKTVVTCSFPSGQDTTQRLAEWGEQNLSYRLWRKDPTVWFAEPQPEITDRLGWLALPRGMQRDCEQIKAFAQEIKAHRFESVVLMGMGGSSLAPEVFQRTFGNAAGYPALHVLDSTHPAAVTALDKDLDLSKTLFIISSKSGTTTEAVSFMHYFWERLSHTVDHPGRQFVAITDPGTPLEETAQTYSFRRVFRAPPDIGGRYSALSVFGMVPAALIGLDIRTFLDSAWTFAERCAFCKPPQENDGLQLGAALGELARKGRDKLTLITSEDLAAFPDWLEQLMAESTGKNGTGIVPILNEPCTKATEYPADRVFVYLATEEESSPDIETWLQNLENEGHPVFRFVLPDKYYLSQELFRWEIAVASAAVVLGIHPFDQPNVELAKKLAKQAMNADGKAQTSTDGKGVHIDHTEEVSRKLHSILPTLSSDSYIALQAYVAPSDDIEQAATEVRNALQETTSLATTFGYGPRFLHSTGQLHKGGPGNAFFLQLTDDISLETPVPGKDYTFKELLAAQADGDYDALIQSSKLVERVHLGTSPATGLRRLAEMIRA